MKLQSLLIFGPLAFGMGCATTSATISTGDDPVPSYEVVENAHFAAISAATDKVEKDRLAILAMQGEHKVTFHFQETVPLKPGYDRREAKDSGGFETVLVIEESPTEIVLQHILVSESGHVVKHWRQDWFFEATQRFEFVEDQTWETRPLETEKNGGAWTQCVYEVSDAPRYCGTGRWNHRYGVSTWTSDRTWRPLPRREYTKRSDYNAINAENRHTVTVHGWTHEQDNTKTVREGKKTAGTLTREFGFNDYRRISGFDFSPGYEYWGRTADYWSRVRAAWSNRLDEPSALVLKTEVDGMPIIAGTFEQAEAATSKSRDMMDAEIENLLQEWTELRVLGDYGQVSADAPPPEVDSTLSKVPSR